jgi:membrane protease YdiL (CAAX protease family)
MMGPNRNESDGPYPDLRSAFMLTIFAMLAAGFTGIAFIDFGILAAVGIGQAIGVGAVATMGAQRVAEPQAQRIGLRALDIKLIPTILCLAPAILLVSELDNFAADWSADSASVQEIARGEDGISVDDYDANNSDAEFDRPEPDKDTSTTDVKSRLVDPDDPWSLLSAFVVMVGIAPVVEEFLFRGVIQQGLVARMGLLRGVTMVAILWTLLRPAPITGISRFLAAAAASFGLGWALGMVRIASGSILGSILLAASWATIGLGAIALEGRIDLPGMNIEDTHLPVLVTLASLFIVGWAGLEIFREAQRRFDLGDDGPGDAGGAGETRTNVRALFGDRE